MPRGSCPWEALPAPRAARQPCGGGAGLPQTEAAPRGAPAPCTHSTSLSWSRARHGRPPPPPKGNRPQVASAIDSLPVVVSVGRKRPHTFYEAHVAPTQSQTRPPQTHKTAGQCPRRTAHKSSTDTTARKPQTPDRADSFRGVSAVPHSQTSRLDSPENRQHPTRSARLQGAKSAFRNPAFLRANSNPTHSCVEKNKTPRSEAKRGGGRRAP